MKEGDRQRLQAFEGVVIGKRNRGLNSASPFAKISNGVGVERTFQSYSPMVDSISVKRRGDVRKGQAVPSARPARPPASRKSWSRPPFRESKSSPRAAFSISAASASRCGDYRRSTQAGLRLPRPWPASAGCGTLLGPSDSYRHAHARRSRHRPLPRCPLAGKGLADNSREAYRNDLASFNGWLQGAAFGWRRRGGRSFSITSPGA